MPTLQPQIAASNLFTLLLAQALHLYLTAGFAGLFLGPFTAMAVQAWQNRARRVALLRAPGAKYPIDTSHESRSASV